MEEAQAIAEKLGVTFRVSIEKRIAGAESVGAHKTSMLQDVEAGRSLETEALIGSVIEMAKLTETPTPAIERGLRAGEAAQPHDAAAGRRRARGEVAGGLKHQRSLVMTTAFAPPALSPPLRGRDKRGVSRKLWAHQTPPSPPLPARGEGGARRTASVRSLARKSMRLKSISSTLLFLAPLALLVVWESIVAAST